jgi:thioredoxin 1
MKLKALTSLKPEIIIRGHSLKGRLKGNIDTMELVITDQNFDQDVLKSSKPVLVDFWAPWCGPCKMVSPAVTELAEELKEHLTVGKMNVDENPQATAKYSIFSIPSLKVFKDGKIIGEVLGAAPKAVIEQKIKAIIGI